MPKLSTVAEIREMEADMPIPAFKGKLTKIWPRKAGESDKGPWSFQNLDFTSGSEKIKVVFKGRDAADKSLQGKVVLLSCNKSDQHGFTGVKSHDNEYNGKTTREILVTPSAVVEEYTDDGSSGTDDNEPMSSHQRQQQGKPPAKGAVDTKPANKIEGGVFGATVGMSINQACIVVNGIGVQPMTAQWSKLVYETASDIIRISRALEAGNLAPKVSERTGTTVAPSKPKEQPKPKPEPEPEPEAVGENEVPGDVDPF